MSTHPSTHPGPHQPSTAPAPDPLRLVVLGASGATGRLAVEHGLRRGHQVHALVREPARFDPTGELTARGVVTHRADVHDPTSVAAAVTASRTASGPAQDAPVVLVSALGVTSKAQIGTLTAGARAALSAGADHVVWMGAVGTGPSTTTVRWPTQQLLRAVFGAEMSDKTTADTTVLEAGGTVVHCGRLIDGSADGWGWLPVAQVPTRWWPTDTPRAAAAAVLVEQAELTGASTGLVVAQRN